MNDDVGFLPGLLVFLGFCLAGCAFIRLTCRQGGEIRRQVMLFLAAYGLRFAFSTWIYVGGLVSVLKDEDASGWTGGAALYRIWVEQGLSVLDLPGELSYMFNGLHPGPVYLRHPHRGYYFLLGALFFLTNSPVRMAAAAMTGFFGALTVVNAYRIGLRLFSREVARRVGLLTCLFPSMIIWSAMTIREPIILFLESLAVYSCICIKNSKFKIFHLSICYFAMVFLTPIRFYASWIVAIMTVLSLVVPDWSRVGAERRVFYRLAAIFVVPIILAASFVFLSRQIEKEKYDTNFLQSYRSGISRVGTETSGAHSGVENPFDTSTPDGLVLGIAFGAAHLALAPFPWQLGGASTRMMLTLPELLYWWYFCFIGVIPGAIYLVRYRFSETWVLFFFLTAFGILYSALFGNIGLVFRQRAQLLPILFLFGAVGIERRRKTRPQPRPGTSLGDPVRPGFDLGMTPGRIPDRDRPVPIAPDRPGPVGGSLGIS